LNPDTVIPDAEATLASVLLRFLTSSEGAQTVEQVGNDDTGQAPPSADAVDGAVSATSSPIRAAAPGDGPSLSMYGLDPAQSKLLEEAIANATAAAQAQAEAEALLEEEGSNGEETEDSDSEMDVDGDIDGERTLV